MKRDRLKEAEAPYFYVPDIQASGKLSEAEAQHAFRVLRLKGGDDIFVTDGRGRLYSAKILSQDTRVALLTDLTLEKELPEDAAKVEVAIAPTKNIDRIEWLLEKLTEFGVDRFSLVLTERTVRKNVSLERLHRLMVAAMKQSKKLKAVEIRLFDSLEDYLASTTYPARYIAYCGEYEGKTVLKLSFAKGVSSSFLIGPEGDFTQEEVAAAVQSDFRVISLGRERLRTETAGLYVGMLHHIIND